jgi:hypothetical protein
MTFRQRMKELHNLLFALQKLSSSHARFSLDSFSVEDGRAVITISVLINKDYKDAQ